MGILAQLIANGIISGSIYALVASGFSLIYSVNKFMHFAHGAVLVVAAYMIFLFANILRLNFVLSSVIAITITALLGVTINFFIYKPMRRRKASSAILLIASIALFIFFNSLMLALFGPDVKVLSLVEKNAVYDWFGARITLIQFVIIITAAILLFALWLLMKKTRLGKAMRAVSDNKEVAQTVGINPEKIYAYSFLAGSVLAAIGGILIALEQNIYPQMGTSLIIKGFTGAVIGGIGSVHGSVLGSLILGLAENLGIWYLPSGYKDAIAFVLLFIFLLFKPKGLFGVKGRV